MSSARTSYINSDELSYTKRRQQTNVFLHRKKNDDIIERAKKWCQHKLVTWKVIAQTTFLWLFLIAKSPTFVIYIQEKFNFISNRSNYERTVDRHCTNGLTYVKSTTRTNIMEILGFNVRMKVYNTNKTAHN